MSDRQREIVSRPDFAQKFWNRVDKTGPIYADLGHCCLWTGAHNGNNAYGQLTIAGQRALAHRVAWELTHGPIPKGRGYHGTCVLHRCDNPPCCNPEHLQLGSNRDNVRDMLAKSRNARGERMGSARLTAAVVLEIRGKFASGTRQVDLVREYGVGPPAVHNIVHRKTWRHVP